MDPLIQGVGIPVGARPFAFLSVDIPLAPMLCPEVMRMQAAELNKDLTSGQAGANRTVCSHSACLGEHHLNLEISAPRD